MANTPREWLNGLMRLGSGPQSLERSLALTVGGLLLGAILVLAFSAVGLLRKQAEQEALARVQLAGIGAREAVRRMGEDAVTAARALAARPSLARVIRDGDHEQLELFLRRSCEVAGMGACAVIVGPATVLASTRPNLGWLDLLVQTAEQGERFALAPPTYPDGLQGAIAAVPDLIETRVVVVRFFDKSMARKLAEEAGMDVRLVRMSKWLDNVDSRLQQLHSSALSSNATAAQRIGGLDLFASSTLITASTGEGVALIEARLPASGVDEAVNGFVRRLAWTAFLLAVVAVIAALVLASRIVRPLQALAASALRLGRGDFSASIPVAGGPETAALARTLEEMRRNLVDLTATLRQREAEAQAMLRGVVEGVFAVDANRNVRYLNPQAAQMAGVNPEAVLGRFCGDVLNPCTDKNGVRPCESACPILAARERGRGQATEFLPTPDGSRRTVIITSARMVDGLQVQVMRDETELEAVRRARDSILANISHEFRTPLAAQLASLELLQDNAGSMPPAQVEELVASLQRGTQRLTRLIDNLLESVRIESGQLSLRAQPVSIEEVVNDAAELVGGLLAQRHQTLEVTLPDDFPEITGDAPRLVQVFVNRLANANKFGPEGRPIRISGERVDREVRVFVEDEGPGVADSDRGSIFERFYRSSDQEPEPKGLGLGLWIVKSIVDRHGGRVATERTADGRTRFIITLTIAGSTP
jgi:signal transduction histidine kinase